MESFKVFKMNPRLRTKANNFHRQASSSSNNDDENLPIRRDWTSVDQIIAFREGDQLGKEYLVKWKELPYDECSWELASGRGSAGKQKSNFSDAMEIKNRQKESSTLTFSLEVQYTHISLKG